MRGPGRSQAYIHAKACLADFCFGLGPRCATCLGGPQARKSVSALISARRWPRGRAELSHEQLAGHAVTFVCNDAACRQKWSACSKPKDYVAKARMLGAPPRSSPLPCCKPPLRAASLPKLASTKLLALGTAHANVRHRWTKQPGAH